MFLAGIVTPGRRDRRRARRAQRRASPPRAAPSPICSATASRAIAHHPGRRARDPARQGRALCRRPAADGPLSASTSVDRIVLAGAFGSHIDVEIRHGARPDPRLRRSTKVRSAGNAAGTGARIALLNVAARARDRRAWCSRIEKVETAIEPRFQEHFVAAMALPHKTAPFPNLAKVVTLPAAKEVISAGEGEARRARDGGGAARRTVRLATARAPIAVGPLETRFDRRPRTLPARGHWARLPAKRGEGGRAMAASGRPDAMRRAALLGRRGRR